MDGKIHKFMYFIKLLWLQGYDRVLTILAQNREELRDDDLK